MDVTRITGLGRDLRTRIRTFFDTPIGRDATPLEIGQAVLDDVERRIEPVGRGRRLLPYSAVEVRVLTDGERRAGVEAVFDGFVARVRDRLIEVRCEAPPVLDVRLSCVDAPPPTWGDGQVFDVRYTRVPGVVADAAPAPAAARLEPPVVSITVVRGATTEPAYSFRDSTVSIGRSADPTDDLGRVRRNRIAFTDVVDGVTETVGRAHARLRFDHSCGGYRLYDEGSSNGTSILRDGEVIVVARRDPRGVRVRSGDEIQVGRALLRVDIG